MPYTSWGWMPQSEVDEIEEDMDLGTITVQLDEPPEWFENTHHLQAKCPIDDRPLWDHESVTVVRASGDIIRCIDPDGEAHEIPGGDEGVFYA